MNQRILSILVLLGAFILSGTLEAKPFQLVVRDRGFFALTLPTGEIVFTKSGQFSKRADGIFVMTSRNLPLLGFQVDDSGTMSNQFTAMNISGITSISVRSFDGMIVGFAPQQGNQIAKAIIALASFKDESKLDYLGEGLYQQTLASGFAAITSAFWGAGSVQLGGPMDFSSPIELNVDGAGYLIVASATTGEKFYARHLSLELDSNNELSYLNGKYKFQTLAYTSSGGPISNVPSNLSVIPTFKYSLLNDGHVLAIPLGNPAIESSVVPLAMFEGEDFLEPAGDELLKESVYSGTPKIGLPGSDERGLILVSH